MLYGTPDDGQCYTPASFHDRIFAAHLRYDFTDGEFIVCHDDNITFAPGETLDVRGAVKLYDDETGTVPCPEPACEHNIREEKPCGYNTNGSRYRVCFYGTWSD